MIKSNTVLVRYNKICGKVRWMMQKEFDSKPVYDDKYTKTKIKPFNCVVDTNFHDSEATKEDMHCVCL